MTVIWLARHICVSSTERGTNSVLSSFLRRPTSFKQSTSLGRWNTTSFHRTLTTNQSGRKGKGSNKASTSVIATTSDPKDTSNIDGPSTQRDLELKPLKNESKQDEKPSLATGGTSNDDDESQHSKNIFESRRDEDKDTERIHRPTVENQAPSTSTSSSTSALDSIENASQLSVLSLPLPPAHQHRRRLVVRRNQVTEENLDDENKIRGATDIRQIVGKYKSTPVARAEIRDSYGQLILKPASRPLDLLRRWSTSHGDDTNDNKEESDDDNSRSSLNSPGSFIRSASIPLLNVAVWLDQQKYVKSSANASTIRSGTEAARRILRGRREWLQTVRKHAERGFEASPPVPCWPNVAYPESAVADNMKRRAVYRLTGHGVPRQLLQDHVDFAGKLLSDHQATTVAIASRESLRVRRADGSHHNAPMPQDAHSLELYLAVMERLAKTLSVVLHNGPSLRDSMYASLAAPSSAKQDSALLQQQLLQRTQSPENGGTTDAPPTNSFSLRPPPSASLLLVHRPIWHVELTRGWVVAEPVMNQLEPVVELVWPRQVCIRLRGRPNDDSRMAVALVYDTTFSPLGKRSD